MPSPPLLYSFRRCPYAIRARMAILHGHHTVCLREVALRDKPAALLAVSPKGTVPVWVGPEDTVLEQSLDIMVWALEGAAGQWTRQWPEQMRWITRNDTDFKVWLDRYKYADRHPDHPASASRTQAMAHLLVLEDALSATGGFLLDKRPVILDLALFPFVRQFRSVDPSWFDALGELTKVRLWLDHWLNSDEFHQAMAPYPRWAPGDEPVWFGPLAPPPLPA